MCFIKNLLKVRLDKLASLARAGWRAGGFSVVRETEIIHTSLERRKNGKNNSGIRKLII